MYECSHESHKYDITQVRKSENTFIMLHGQSKTVAYFWKISKKYLIILWQNIYSSQCFCETWKEILMAF